MITGEVLKAAATLSAATHGRYSKEHVRVKAGDLKLLVNAFWQETKRADVNGAKLAKSVNELLAILGQPRARASLN